MIDDISEEYSDGETGQADGQSDPLDSVSSSSEGSDLASTESSDDASFDDQNEDLDMSPNESRREKRRRKKMLEGIASSLGLPTDEVLETLQLIDDMLPQEGRMSTSSNVGERIAKATADMRARHPKLIFNRRVQTPLDVKKDTRYFKPNGELESIYDNEEALLRAIVINDRVRNGIDRWVMEHDAVRSLLLTEYVKRSTMVEQWRHLLPKYMLPVFSMLDAAGASSRDVRPNMALFNKIRDVIVEWGNGRIDRSDLMAAAQRTEEEFIHSMKRRDENGEPVELFEESIDRLRAVIEDARSGDEAGAEVSSEHIERLDQLLDMGAGMDRSGRIVFSSADALVDRIEALTAAVAPVAKGKKSKASKPVSKEPVDDAEPVEATQDNASTKVSDLSEDGTDSAPEALADGSAQDTGSDIPVDLFRPDDEDKGSDHPFAEGSLPTGDASTPPSASPTSEPQGEPSTGSTDAADMPDDKSTKEPSKVSGVVLDELEALPPIGGGRPVFDPKDLENWPVDDLEVRRLVPGLPRSTGLSRSTFDRPFSMWKPTYQRPPFSFMGFRFQPDLVAREGRDGLIEPVDLSRLEIGEGQWRATTMDGPSSILGASHPLMLPPHSRLEWYGRTLGWSETDIRSLAAFGSPAKPETIKPKGDGRKLIDALRGVAAMRIAELAQKEKGHFLAQAGEVGEARRAEAVEDLARYWLFVLVTRHDQSGFDLIYTEGFFNGIHGPDFVVDAQGKADFGSQDLSSHIGVWSPVKVRTLPAELVDKPFSSPIGLGVMSGMRRIKF